MDEDPDLDRRRQSEAERVRRVYRARDTGYRDVLSRYSLSSLMALQEKERRLLEEFSRRGWDVASLDCLDVGCGTGGQLARLVAYGADPRRLHGIDLGDEAIVAARARLPLCDLLTGDASELPYASGSMDVVMQQTVLSSILDDEVRRKVAAEMIRVSRPSGLIVSYDFIRNPTNADTRGLGKGEIVRLFPGCQVRIQRLTLAPPIARRIAPRSRRLAAMVGTIPPLKSHLMAFVSPQPNVKAVDG